VSKLDASMRRTHVFGGTPGKRPVMFSQAPPSFRVSHTLPSSVPTQITWPFFGDSLMA
jgi:hypothetical protein